MAGDGHRTLALTGLVLVLAEPEVAGRDVTPQVAGAAVALLVANRFFVRAPARVPQQDGMPG